MKAVRTFFAAILILLVISVPAFAGEAKGVFKMGYTFEDEEGSQAVERSSYNVYEGFGLSLEDVIWTFGDGFRLNADLKNITLNNRNLMLGLQKDNLYRFDLYNHQYRRVYDFDGSKFTRRHNSGGSFWHSAHKYLRLYGGMNYFGRSGNQLNVFDTFDDNATAIPEEVDYNQTNYHFGMTFRQKGRMLQGEFRGSSFSDNEDSSRDQKRQAVKLWGFVPVPSYEWIRLHGGFRHFETKYQETEFKISANTVWGGAQVYLPFNLSLSYYGMLDRAQSDSDLVATDNMSHAVYGTYTFPRKAGLTAGYQFDTVDDFEDEVEANSIYLYGWFKPMPKLDIRAEFGSRAEEMFAGSRVLGDVDQTKHRVTVKYKFSDYNYIRGKMMLRSRESDYLGTEVDFWRGALDGYYKLTTYADLSIGYNYTEGEYTNMTAMFEFSDHLIYGDLILNEPLSLKGTVLSFGGMYYKSKRDLDIEKITLRFGAEYNLFRDYYLEADYDVHNFDDLTVLDRYYTANIVTISLNKRFNY